MGAGQMVSRLIEIGQPAYRIDDVVPRERLGEIAVSLRGELAAFLHAADMPQSGAGVAGDAGASNVKKAVALVGNGRSGLEGGVLELLDAGTGFEPVTFRL